VTHHRLHADDRRSRTRRLRRASAGAATHDAALMDLRVSRSPLFATATVLLAIAMVVLFGAPLIFPPFYQQAVHLSTLPI
jgi:hypothetical protein